MSAEAAAVALALLAGLLGSGARPDPDRLTRRLRADPPASWATPGTPPTGAPAVPAWVPRVTGAAAGVALVTGHGGAASALVALAVAVGLPAAASRRADARYRAVLARDLARAAELLGTCLGAGAAPSDALTAVADAVGGPVAARLRPVAAALAAGADLGGRADHRADDRPDPVARLVRVLVRAAETGAPLVASVRDLAADERARLGWEAQERARRAGVQAVGPLAACFLPAFVLVGVLPVVVGVARSLLVGWS